MTEIMTDSLYKYDIFSDSYSKLPLKLKTRITKILCYYENQVYAIEGGGSIYESEINDEYL